MTPHQCMNIPPMPPRKIPFYNLSTRDHCKKNTVLSTWIHTHRHHGQPSTWSSTQLISSVQSLLSSHHKSTHKTNTKSRKVQVKIQQFFYVFGNRWHGNWMYLSRRSRWGNRQRPIPPTPTLPERNWQRSRLGDLSRYSLGPTLTKTTDEFILVNGDISYARGWPWIWEVFFDLVQPLTTIMPMMETVVGNVVLSQPNVFPHI